jgi:hypothetical protein
MTNARISRLIHEQVIQRANGCCEYCAAQQKFSMDTFSVEHIFPKSRGGSDELNNLALSCQGCNACKSNRTEVIDPETRQTIPLYNPRTDSWSDHFVWSKDYTNLIGLIPNQSFIATNLACPQTPNSGGFETPSGLAPPLLGATALGGFPDLKQVAWAGGRFG